MSKRRLVSAELLWVGVLAVSACSRPAPSSKPELLGDMTAVVSVKELMESMIDPGSDYVFDAVGTEVTVNGVRGVAPKTDEDWAKVRIGAVTLAEGIYLLKVPRPLTPPGDVNVSAGPNPPELSPTEIKAKIDTDPVLWNAKIEALRNVALEILDIVKRKDADELFAANGDLDQACEGCHLEYWYPGEKERRERRRVAAVGQSNKK
jgi:hypothetical protein